MKKAIKILLILIVFSLIGLLAWKSLNTFNAKQMRVNQITFIPHLELQCLNTNCSQLSDLLKENKGLLLIVFNSECEHCQNEAKLINENLENLQNVNIVFVSTEEVNTVSNFRQRYFENNTTLTFATTSAKHLNNAFKEITYPNIFLYDVKGILIKEFKGQTQISPLIKCGQQGC